MTGDLVHILGICQLGPRVQVNHCGSRGFSGARGAAPAQLDTTAWAGRVARQRCYRNLHFCIIYPVLKWC